MNRFAQISLLAGALIATATVSVAAQQSPNNQRQPRGTQSSQDCVYDLGFMRRPNAHDIAAIGNQRVSLIPVCEEDFSNRNDYGSLFRDGNVESLRTDIARNGTLMQALGARAYDHNDVVSLRFGGNNSIILYVHQRDM